jgi:pimeloyl-ACP methyl ester carboxylesterase
VVLVHGAWHGAWCWQRLTPHLTQRKVSFRTVDLPSVGAGPGQALDLSADAAAVRAVVSRISGPVILCGHSYGGMVISLAGSGQSQVERLVYICAFVPDSGESLTSFGGGKLAPWVNVLDGGLTLPDLERTATVFYGDCDPASQQWATRQLRPQPRAAFDERVPAPAWKSIASTYVVCANDGALPAKTQRSVFAARTTTRVEIAADHSPFISKPAELAEAITQN